MLQLGVVENAAPARIVPLGSDIRYVLPRKSATPLLSTKSVTET